MQSSPYKKAPESKLANKAKHKRNISIVSIIVVFSLILGLMYLIFPKEKQVRAIKTLGGYVNNSALEPNKIYNGLIISEIMATNNSAVPDENGKFNDYIEIFNSNDYDINLRGVGLSDKQDRIRFIFPEYNLKSKGFVVVFTSNKNKVDASGVFHAKFKLSSIGETVFLYDPNAYIIDSVQFPVLGPDETYMLAGDGKYNISTQYSPGFDNTEEGFIAYRESEAVNIGAVIINEIMPDPVSGLRDENDVLCDWVELYNTTDSPISLANYALSDKENKPLKWHFPAYAIIPAKGYYLVFCSGNDVYLPVGQISHTNFRISAESETIVLSDSKGRLLDRISIDNIPRDCSYGRKPDESWQIFNLPSPNGPNDSIGQANADKIIMQNNPTGVYISEVVASNDTTQIGPSLTTSDFVELYNSSNKPVNLSGCGLSDNIGRARRWVFPAGAQIAANSYLIVFLDGMPQLSNSIEYHSNFKLLRTGGETICFSDPTGRVLDRIPLPEIPTNISYGRTSSAPGFFYFEKPSPGKANENAFLGFTQVPLFSIPGGQYKNSIEVKLSIPEGAAVYYTMDGSLPTEQSSRYNGEVFNLNNTVCLRARAFSANLKPSVIVTQSYLLNLYHSFPVVSISVDPNELYNPERGIFTPGENIDKSKGIPFKNAIYREYGKEERPGHIEMYDLDGTVILNQDMEFGLQGQYSLDMPQKTLKVRAKSRYGSKYFYSKLFENRDFTEYKTFVLRNSGNDCVWTRIIDSFQSMLVEHLDTTVINQATRPVILYINGQYWGHYNMRERADRFFVAQHEGLSLKEASNMDMVEANRKVYYGSNKEFLELNKTADALSPRTNDEDLKYLTDRIDVLNYFDYTAIEMFFGNSDPGNIRCYKLKTEGSKWRWLLFDMDYGLFSSSYNSPKSYLKPTGAGDQRISNILIRRLLENDDMKDLFLQRLAIVYKKFTSEFMLDELDKMVEKIEPEMQMHFNRWAEFNDKAINIDSPLTPEGAITYWRSRIDRLKNVIRKRPNLLYGYIQEQFALSNSQMLAYFGDQPPLPPETK